MSILGYSAAYFLPEYWAHTPLYGEKIIPLIDYMLSTDYVGADKLANAYYDIQNKYKNIADLPVEKINELIDESGFSYVRALMGDDEDNVRLLLMTLCLVQCLKGSGKGIEVMLNLLRNKGSSVVFGVVGSPVIVSQVVTDFSTSDYVQYSGFTTDEDAFELTFQVTTPSTLHTEQCIASCSNYKFSLGIDSDANIALCVGTGLRSYWDIIDNDKISYSLNPNTTYYIRFAYTGYNYDVLISTDGKKYKNIYNKVSTTAMGAHHDVMYFGIDGATSVMKNPFLGSINLAPLTVNVENISITEWYEENPVGDENTFLVKADLDIDLISADFFTKFASFVKRYVYPTLKAFEAKISIDCNLAFIPYIRSKVTYVAYGDANNQPFECVAESSTEESASAPHVPFDVIKEEGTGYDKMYTSLGDVAE